MKKSVSAYWNKIGSSYASEWTYNGRKYVSSEEEKFLSYSINNLFTKNHQTVTALDLGVGAGRILSVLEKSKIIDSLTGIDFSDEMLLYCKNRFRNSKKIKKLIRHDISKKLPFENNKFDIITTIRAIKYNSNWKDILRECYRILKKKGILIFEMPNINSVNRLSKDEVSMYKTTLKELKQTLSEKGFEILHIKGGPVLPGFLYNRIKGLPLRLAILSEKFFKIIFGKTYLSRFIYIVCQKN